MGRRFGLSGDSLARVRYASQLVALLVALLLVAFPFDTLGGVALALLFASLAAAATVGLWRTRTDDVGDARLGTAEDITDDPFADPGQAAKDRWETAVRRLPGRDDERE